jgi:3-methyladenine DNA glycosylase AlkD
MPNPFADRIRKTLSKSPPRAVPVWRLLRRQWSRELRGRPDSEVVEISAELLDEGLWGRLTAYELIASHPRAIAALTPELVDRLGRGLADWASVDTFACYVAGPAWRLGRIPTRQIHRWLRSPDRWQRRTAVVCTVALNVRARGGSGDVSRTLAVCRKVVADRDDMVVKALSWALRALVEWDRAAVADFLREHEPSLAARVKREVTTKLQTGRKNRPKASGAAQRRKSKGAVTIHRRSRRVR